HEHEVAEHRFPSREHVSRARTMRVARVLFQQPPQQIPIARIDDMSQGSRRLIAPRPELTPFVENESNAAAHPGGEVAARASEDDDHAAPHVLAPVVAYPFDDGDRAAVAHREPLPSDPAK